MNAKHLVSLRTRQPFAPFRLVMSDGRYYDVRHPELLTVGKSISSIGVADKEEEYVLADHFVWVDNDHITSTIPLTVADQVGLNGAAK
jgi:hypothetical protein